MPKCLTNEEKKSMKVIFHKIAAYTVVIFISTQPVSIDVLAAEKESTQDIAFWGEDKNTTISKRKGQSESGPHLCPNTGDALPDAHGVLRESGKTGTKAMFPRPAYLAKKAADFWAWFNTDIEADLH